MRASRFVSKRRASLAGYRGKALKKGLRQFFGIVVTPWQEICRNALCGTLSPTIQHMLCQLSIAVATPAVVRQCIWLMLENHLTHGLSAA
jgi:hypothetical protein